MKPFNKTHQTPNSSPFTDGIILKVRKYETKRKNRQRIIEATAIIFLSYLLLMDQFFLIKKSHHDQHMNFDGITEELIQLKHQKSLIQTFGLNAGKVVKVNRINYIHS